MCSGTRIIRWGGHEERSIFPLHFNKPKDYQASTELTLPFNKSGDIDTVGECHRSGITRRDLHAIFPIRGFGLMILARDDASAISCNAGFAKTKMNIYLVYMLGGT